VSRQHRSRRLARSTDLTIWKFEIPLKGSFSIDMPAGAKILCVQTQNGEPYLRALVDESAEKVQRLFVLFITGHGMNDVERAHYLGTFQRPPLVWHLFELTAT